MKCLVNVHPPITTSSSHGFVILLTIFGISSVVLRLSALAKTYKEDVGTVAASVVGKKYINECIFRIKVYKTLWI